MTEGEHTETYHLVIKGGTENAEDETNTEVVYQGEATSYLNFLAKEVPNHILEGSDWEVRTAIFCTDKDEMVHDGFIEEVTD